MKIFAFDSVENIVGQGENAGFQHFLLVPHCFQMDFSLGVIKSWDCVVKSYMAKDGFSFTESYRNEILEED